jgi:hypothetical protein
VLLQRVVLEVQAIDLGRFGRMAGQVVDDVASIVALAGLLGGGDLLLARDLQRPPHCAQFAGHPGQ